MSGGLEFDLGGVGCGGNRKTVNLVQPCDIECDIRDLDVYCEDGAVSLFYLSHTLEHVPTQHYVQFLRDLHRKLRSTGCVEVVQTDVGRLLKMVTNKELSLRTARLAIFVPADRLRENPHHQHFNMWSADMLCEDFVRVGFGGTEIFDAGGWSFDCTDELFPELSRQYRGVSVPNLGVRAFKYQSG